MPPRAEEEDIGSSGGREEPREDLKTVAFIEVF